MLSFCRLASSRKVLIVSPFPPDRAGFHGGTQVIGRLIHALARTHSVGAVYFQNESEPPIERAVAERCALLEEVPRASTGVQRQGRLLAALAGGEPMWVEDWRSAAFAARLRHAIDTWQPDIIQYEYHVMAQYAERQRGSVMVVHEAGTAAARDRYRWGSGWRKAILQRDLGAWETYERKQLGAVDAVVCFTARDQRELSELRPGTRVEVIPPLGPEPHLDRKSAAGHSVLFIGNFVHPPNVEAALRLCRTIFPKVRERFPQAVLHLVGDGAPEELRRAAGAGVQLLGRVPDVAPLIEAATVFAAPLNSGGGIRIKMMDALAYGKAIVATPLACEGFLLTQGLNVIQAEDDEAFARGLVMVLGDPEARVRLETNALRFARETSHGTQTVAAFEKLYDSIHEGAE